jgi:very-short-patch-repair endonuclease
VELALESALRGVDPRQPDVWNTELLSVVAEFPDRPRVLGHATLKAVLRRRPQDARPTGSAAETKLVQALRVHGLDLEVVRQADVTVIDVLTGARLSIFPDFLFPDIGLAIEVDGVAVHSGFDRRLRDDRRENRMGAALRVLRFTGVDVNRRSAEIAAEIAVEVAAQRRRMHERRWVVHEQRGLWTHRYTIPEPEARSAS